LEAIKIMIKLSTGVEVSESTVISALKKAGISVEPKHVFEAGDVAYYGGRTHLPSEWRFIVSVDGKLRAINRWGSEATVGQGSFEACGYKYTGRLTNIVK